MFELSFAGVALLVPQPKLRRWVDAHLGGLRLPGPLGFPASKLAGLTSFASPPLWRPHVNSLYWPAGASRYAVGCFLASTSQLDAIYAAMPAGESATLVLDTGNDSGRVELSMRMLPARSLAYPDGDPAAEGLFLLTLVDTRYFWYGKFTGSGTAVVTDDTTTWNSVITAIATDLGITITADTAASADWGYAPNGLDLSGQPAAIVLDAILYACGLRFTQDDDGNYLARDADADTLAVKNSLTSALRDIRASGGPFSLSRDDLPFDGDTVDDQPLVLPEKVRLVVSAGGTVNEVNCNLFDQDSAFEIIRPGVAREWRTTRLVYGSVTSQTYVESLARSYGLRLLSAVSRRFAGIVNWGAEGVNDAIEWVYRLDESYTTIHPPPWHDGVLELVGPDLAASASGAVEGRITGRPKCTDGHKWYPAVLFPFDAATDAAATGTTGMWTDGDPVWLRQADDAPLGTTGKMKVWMVPDANGATKTISDDTRPLYGTHDRMAVMKVACVSGEIVNYYEDEYQGCADSGGLWANGMFPVGLWAEGMFP